VREKIVVVHLRRPRKNRPNDKRSDPFWEFGSFGLTGCHGRNLMHPKRAGELVGARLAFVQGGSHGARLVFLSPPIRTVKHKNVVEARWKPARPFKYSSAPLIVAQDGKTDFPKFKGIFSALRGVAWTSKFSSGYRTCCRFLPADVARELARNFGRAYLSTDDSLAKKYEEALPFLPPKVDKKRRQTYTDLLLKASK